MTKFQPPDGSFLLVPDKVWVDLKSLRGFRHMCVSCKRTDSCCRSYEVEVTWKEITRIDSLMPQITRYLPELIEKNGYQDVFRDAEDDVLVIETDINDTCPLLIKRSGRCSVHRVALDLGLDPYQTKPFLCAAWPLSILSLAKGKSWLTADESAQEFHCTSRTGAKKIYPEIIQHIRDLFGDDAAQRLGQAARKSPTKK